MPKGFYRLFFFSVTIYKSVTETSFDLFLMIEVSVFSATVYELRQNVTQFLSHPELSGKKTCKEKQINLTFKVKLTSISTKNKSIKNVKRFFKAYLIFSNNLFC